MISVSNYMTLFFYQFVKYRIHISLIFLFLLINVFKKSTNTLLDWPVILSFFSWHFALYIFDRAYDADLDSINQPQEAITFREKKYVILLSILLAIVPLFILFFTNKLILPYIPFLPVTFLYTLPIKNGIRSKNILIFKNIYSALFIWTLPLAIVTYYYTCHSSSFLEICKNQFTGLFLYVMVGEAFWDIRDIEGDKANHVKTIPVVFGVITCKIYLISLIIIDWLAFGNSVGLSTLVYLILILIIKPNSSRWIFHIPPLLALVRFLIAMN